MPRETDCSKRGHGELGGFQIQASPQPFLLVWKIDSS